MVFFDGTFNLGLRTTFINGGQPGLAYIDSEPRGCAAGAAGTTYWKEYDTLMVNNEDI